MRLSLLVVVLGCLALLPSLANAQERPEVGRYKVVQVFSKRWNCNFDYLLDTTNGALRMRFEDKWLDVPANPARAGGKPTVGRYEIVPGDDIDTTLLLHDTASAKAWTLRIFVYLSTQPIEEGRNELQVKWSEVTKKSGQR